jgi:hypothetical protein
MQSSGDDVAAPLTKQSAVDLNNNNNNNNNNTTNNNSTAQQLIIEPIQQQLHLSSQDNCEQATTNLYSEIQTLFYTSHVDLAHYLDLIPMPSDKPVYHSTSVAMSSSSDDDEDDADFENEPEDDEDDSSSDSDEDENEEEEEDEEDEPEDVTSLIKETRRASSLLTSSTMPPRPKTHKLKKKQFAAPPFILTKQTFPKFNHDYTVDSFEVLEQTILKQKRLARLKNTDLRRKILLKRTFDLVCEIMDKENGFAEEQPQLGEELIVTTTATAEDDSDSDSDEEDDDEDDSDEEIQQPVNVTINASQQRTISVTPPPPTYQNLEIVQLDQQPISEHDLNDIIYINLINQSDLLDSLSEFGCHQPSPKSSDGKRRRTSTEEEDEHEEELEDDEYDDYYAASNQNILILNKNNEYDLNEQVLSEFSAGLFASCGGQNSAATAATVNSNDSATCVFYSETEKVVSEYNRKRFYESEEGGERKRTRFSD